MTFLVVVSLLVAAEASKLQNLPSVGSSSFNHGLTSSGANQFDTSFGQELTFANKQTSSDGTSFSQETNTAGTFFDQIISSTSTGSSPCRDDEVLHVDGKCVVPEVTRNFFGFFIPDQPHSKGPTQPIPKPKVEENILFVRLPEDAAEEDPIVVPPPRQTYIVYILKKKSHQSDVRVIDVPEAPKSNPEVYYVNYVPGENPVLPGGIDLQAALNSATQGTGQVLGVAGSSHFGSGHAADGFENSAFNFSQTGQSASEFGSSGLDFSKFSEASSNSGSTFATASSGSSSSVSVPTSLYTTPKI